MLKRLISIFTDSRLSFHGQEPGECVSLIIRPHIFTVLGPLSLVFLAVFIPPLVKLAFSAALLAFGLTGIFVLLSAFWYAGLWLLAFYVLMLYCLNTVIITDRRLVENEQKGFFNRKVSELHLYRIQDVSAHTEGFIETLLTFGDITVQTAAAEKEFVFRQIGHPEAVKDVIMRLVSRRRPEMGPSEPVHNSSMHADTSDKISKG